MKPICIGEVVHMSGGVLLQGDTSLVITSVEHDSRQVGEGTLFVPIIGERVDGHDFIEEVFSHDAVCTFTSKRNVSLIKGKAYILVEDTLAALQKLAAAYRDLFSIPIIGVTGSVGKTTTKEMIADVLEKKYKVLRTIKNLNSQIGLAMMMFYIEEDTQIAVIEMGISMFGEMERLVAIAKPQMAVLTNIGVSHIANLGSRESICHEKGKIINESQDGTLYICGNEDYIKLTKENIDKNKIKGDCKFVYYGMNENCQAYADKIKITKEEETMFTFRDGHISEKMKLGVLGIHNVSNALVATLIGLRFDVPMEDIKTALYDYRPMDMRGKEKKKDGITVIDDTYNASPDSILSGLNVLYEKKSKGRKIAVLADVLELGEYAREQHENIGYEILKSEKKRCGLTELITVGSFAKYIADVVEKGSASIKVKSFVDREVAISYLISNKKKNDVYLIKGSRGMRMDEVVSSLFE